MQDSVMQDSVMQAARSTHRAGSSKPDRYWNLLTQIMTATVDEDYAAHARAAGHGDRPRAGRYVAVTLALFGVLIGISAVQTAKDRPAEIAERAQLVSQIHVRQDYLASLHDKLVSLQNEVSNEQRALSRAVSRDDALAGQQASLGVDAGTTGVTGPGLHIVVDDAPGGTPASGGIVRDSDLRMLVNGLWQAGAEAIAINGNRLTSLTSIRYAGQAITVDYRSMTPPYDVDAIGSPQTLEKRFLGSLAGQTWLGLKAAFGIGFRVEASGKLSLPAEPIDHLLYAQPEGAHP